MMTTNNSFRLNRVRRRVVWLLAVFLALPSVSPSTASSGPPAYGKKGSWAETLLALREPYAQWWQSQLGEITLASWHTTELDDIRSLCQTIDLATRDKNGNRCWQVHPELLDGVIHYDLSNHGLNQQRRLPGEEDDVVFSEESGDFDADSSPANLLQIREIEAPGPMTVTAWIGAEYGMEVWLNGRRVFSDARLGDGLQPQPDQAEVELPLTAGTNQLVLRFLDVRRSGFYFSTVEQDRLARDPIENLLQRLEEDFPIPTARMLGDVAKHEIIAWFRNPHDVDLIDQLTEQAAEQLGSHNRGLQAQLLGTQRDLELYAQASRLRKAWSDLEMVNFAATRRAIRDLSDTFPDRYVKGEQYLRQIDAYEQQVPRIQVDLERGNGAALDRVADLIAFQRKALLKNPLLDFDHLLLIQREPLGNPRRAEAPNRGMGEFLGLPQQSSWQLDRIRQPFGWKNEIRVLSNLRADARLETLYRPPTPRLISDIDLHFDGNKLLFSMPGSHYHWQVFEMGVDGRDLRQVSPGDQNDIHNFDACYLPNEEIVFVSTAARQGVPCSNGIAVAMNFRMDADGNNVRQLCFDQDHDWFSSTRREDVTRPTVSSSGFPAMGKRSSRLSWTSSPSIAGRNSFTLIL